MVKRCSLNFGTKQLPDETQAARFKALDTWFLSAQGMNVAKAMAIQLALIDDLLHGDIIIQLGLCGQNIMTNASHFNKKWVVSPYKIKPVSLVAPLNQLPFVNNSIDCIVAPLTLTMSIIISNLLDEIDRLVKPMGWVIFFGINPWSLWGYWARFSPNNYLNGSKITLYSVLTVKRMLLCRGYRLCHLSNFYYVPPVNHQALISHLQLVDDIGKMISLIPAGFYCVVAQKYLGSVMSLTPIKNTWQDRFHPIVTA